MTASRASMSLVTYNLHENYVHQLNSLYAIRRQMQYLSRRAVALDGEDCSEPRRLPWQVPRVSTTYADLWMAGYGVTSNGVRSSCTEASPEAVGPTQPLLAGS